MDPEATTLQFVSAINRRDPTEMVALMTTDHVFVDSDGTRLGGREAVLGAWQRYFEIMCEYEILIQDRLSRGQLVILIGRARGTRDLQAPHLPKCSWTVPAAWRALVRDGLVAEWQAFVNPEPIRMAVDDVGQRAD